MNVNGRTVNGSVWKFVAVGLSTLVVGILMAGIPLLVTISSSVSKDEIAQLFAAREAKEASADDRIRDLERQVAVNSQRITQLENALSAYLAANPGRAYPTTP